MLECLSGECVFCVCIYNVNNTNKQPHTKVQRHKNMFTLYSTRRMCKYAAAVTLCDSKILFPHFLLMAVIKIEFDR